MLILPSEPPVVFECVEGASDGLSLGLGQVEEVEQVGRFELPAGDEFFQGSVPDLVL